MIRLTPKESRYFHPLIFFSSQGMKKILVEFLIPGLLVSRDQKMIFWSLGWQILSFEIVWVFVWIFLGRHIDMSYYYSSVFLFLKNFLVFFFFFSFASLFFEQVWSEQRGGGLFQTFLAFFVKSFDSFFSGRVHSGNPSPGNECKNGRQIFGEVGLLDTTVWTWNDLWIIREKTESLVGMNYQLLAIVTLKRKREKPLIIEYFSKPISWKFFGALANQNE